MSSWTVPSYADDWTVPGYTEERELGRGASGKVVEAVNNATGQRVAIKYLSPSLVDDPAFMWGFRTEAQMLKSLGVPQVVQVYDYVEQPGQGAAIVMELVNGVSLHEMIERRGPTGPEAALVVLKGSLLGLAAAHTLGIVHRDYKPENVLVDTAGNSKLADFGVAVREGRQAAAAGTPLYMAPEQWQGAPASPATDVYAATAVFFECLTGKTPFSGKLLQLQAQHVTASVPIDRVDAPLQGLIARGMAKSPSGRPQSAIAFVAELEAVAGAAYGEDWEERGRPAAAAVPQHAGGLIGHVVRLQLVRRGRRPQAQGPDHRRGRGGRGRRGGERGYRGHD
jgi:serine/threonine protein kinase